MSSLKPTVLSALALCSACGEGDDVRRVRILAHYVPACAPEARQSPAQLELTALGDFDRSNESVSILASDASSERVTLPPDTLAAELATLGQRSHWGSGVLSESEISILLWPRDDSCPLGPALPGVAARDVSFGGSAELGTVLLAAGPSADAEITGFAVRLSDASYQTLSPETGLSRTRRDSATTRLGEALIVSGGLDPERGEVLASGELFDPETGRFERDPVALSTPRFRHAALTLASGDAMLLGGETDGVQALSSVEVISRHDRAGSRELSLLQSARIAPSALLMGERILVGGGYTWELDQTEGNWRRRPVPTLEFLSVDLAELTRSPVSLEPAALDRAFVELGAGSALAVGGCESPADQPECERCDEGRGCVSRAVFWIDALGEVERLPDLDADLASARPRLARSSEAMPWLLSETRVARFDPWTKRFERADLGRVEETLPATSSPLSLQAGPFLWVTEAAGGARLSGRYPGPRSTFSQDVAPLLLDGGAGLVPHRPPTSENERGTVLSFASDVGLSLAGPEAVASIATTRYADLTLGITLASGPPPLVRLVADSPGGGQTETFGGLSCAWPAFASPRPDVPGDWVELTLRRSDDVAWLGAAQGGLESDGVEGNPCATGVSGRVGIQLVGPPEGVSQVTRIQVRRSLE